MEEANLAGWMALVLSKPAQGKTEKHHPSVSIDKKTEKQEGQGKRSPEMVSSSMREDLSASSAIRPKQDGIERHPFISPKSDGGTFGAR